MLDETIALAHVEVALCTDHSQLRELISGWNGTWNMPDVYPNSREWSKLPFDSEIACCPLLDDAWNKYLEETHYNDECEAWDRIVEYWKEDLPDIEIDRGWIKFKNNRFNGYDIDQIMHDEDDDVPIEVLRDFYLAKVNGDRMFDYKVIEDELTYQVLWQRARWEEDLEP